VGELWKSFKVPDFVTFHQEGINHSGGVCVIVGKHLKATRVETNIKNTVIVDIVGLSEPIRVIGIYWPHSQKRDLNDLCPYLIKNTIISGDFNATVAGWGKNQITDTRGQTLQKWIQNNNFSFIP
ncbi:unnamed protein product, partial [Didymodactylos carnosus]